MMIRRSLTCAVMAAAVALSSAQTAATRQSGKVKSVSGTGVTITAASGQDVSVSLTDTTKILLVDPVTKDLKNAPAGTPADIAPGDMAIVSGTGDAASFTAARVYVMKAAAIAQSHAAEDAAWAQGIGGLVKSSDAAAGTITLLSSGKTVIVSTTPKTIYRHYAGDSVKFSDAVRAGFADVQVGDQLRVRGAKSADGTTITADEMVAGTFHNYSGLLTAVDATAGTVTLKDLATKKVVVVSVTANTDLHRMPPMVAQMLAARMKGGAAGTPPAGMPAPPAGGGVQGGGRLGGAPGGAAGASGDLSRMVSRLPAETLAGLKAGDAVMMVATGSAGSEKATAVTLIAGVDAILTAAPSGEMTLSPWSVGGSAPDGSQ